MHLSGLSGHEDYICFNILILAIFANLQRDWKRLYSRSTRIFLFVFFASLISKTILSISEIVFLHLLIKITRLCKKMYCGSFAYINGNKFHTTYQMIYVNIHFCN